MTPAKKHANRHRPRRSVLYMPSSNPRALEKAKTITCDALILDLEDAVAPDAKEGARDAACAAVKSGEYGRKELIIRVNALNTEWHYPGPRVEASGIRVTRSSEDRRVCFGRAAVTVAGGFVTSPVAVDVALVVDTVRSPVAVGVEAAVGGCVTVRAIVPALEPAGTARFRPAVSSPGPATNAATIANVEPVVPTIVNAVDRLRRRAAPLTIRSSSCGDSPEGAGSAAAKSDRNRSSSLRCGSRLIRLVLSGGHPAVSSLSQTRQACDLLQRQAPVR